MLSGAVTQTILTFKKKSYVMAAAQANVQGLIPGGIYLGAYNRWIIFGGLYLEGVYLGLICWTSLFTEASHVDIYYKKLTFR